MVSAETGDTVDVVYATPNAQRVVEVPFTPGLTAIRAIELAGLLEEYPEIQDRPLVLGIFGERVEETHVLAPGNRVEICRPLQQDPRTMRWSVTATGGVMGRSQNDKDK